MKRLSIYCSFIFVIIFFTTLHAQDIETVYDYYDQNDMEDKYHLSQLAQRCAGVTGAYAKYLPQTMQDERKVLAEVSGKFVELAGMMLLQKGMTDTNNIVRQVSTGFQFYVDNYYKQIEVTQLSTGSIFEGRVSSELIWCRDLYKQLN